MNDRSALVRKITFAGIMVVLLVPMYYLGQPSAAGDASQGGLLAQQRAEYHLAQSNLGEIDPTSEAMKLASLGLRGIYATWLWGKSNDYKETENWTAMSATLEQITKLQPHFVSVWRYQGWNLAYNLSVEMDDYRYRYYWVTRGIEFIDKGEEYNQHDTRLFWDEGWTTAQKIGRADEVVQYRRLFRDDEYQLVENLYGAQQIQDWKDQDVFDNWFVGRESFIDAIDMVEAGTVEGNRAANTISLRFPIFFSEPTKCLIRFAYARQKEGDNGEQSKRRWRQCYAEWTDGLGPVDIRGAREPVRAPNPRFADAPFGEREIILVRGQTTPAQSVATMLSLDEALAQRDDYVNRMLEMAEPGLAEKLRDERLESLLTEIEGGQRELPDNYYKNVIRTISPMRFGSLSAAEQFEMKDARVGFWELTPDDVYGAMDPATQRQAISLLEEARASEDRLRVIRQDQQLVNYEYWRRRCEAEATPLALEAHDELYAAVDKLVAADPLEARELFESGFAKWRNLLDGWHIRDYENILIDLNAAIQIAPFSLRNWLAEWSLSDVRAVFYDFNFEVAQQHGRALRQTAALFKPANTRLKYYLAEWNRQFDLPAIGTAVEQAVRLQSEGSPDAAQAWQDAVVALLPVLMGPRERPTYFRIVFDGDTSYDMLEFARRYEEIFNGPQTDSFPEDFPLWDVINSHNPFPPIGR